MTTKVSTLGFALLGILARGDACGYDIVREMQAPVSHFWQAQHSQIYPELARLEAAGLVEHRRIAQHDRPDKKVYSISTYGLDALREWLTAETDVPTKRDELTLKAYSIWLADPARAATLFREHEQAHRTQQGCYEAKLAALEQQWGEQLRNLSHPQFGCAAALRRGIGSEREYADWCAWLADTLDSSAAPLALAGNVP